MADAIAESGNELSSPWVLEPSEGRSIPVSNVFDRDRRGVKSSDAVVADVSSPSIGVGMELMAAHHYGKRVIVAFKRKSVVSRMLLQMEPKETIEFYDDAELHRRLVGVLRAAAPD